MRLSVVSAWQDLPASALTLMDTAEANCLFLGHQWFQLLSSQIIGADEEPMWLMLVDDKADETLEILPLISAKRGRTRVLSSLSNFYTPYFSSITSNAAQTDLLPELLQRAHHVLDQFDVIELSPLSEKSLTVLLQAVESLPFSTEKSIQTFNWRETEVRSFDEYWSARPSQLKNTVSRKKRKIDRLGGYELSMANPLNVEGAINDYCEVYRKSWKADEQYPEFMEGLIRTYAPRGALRLGFMHHEQTPVAAQIWFVHNRTASIYKLAYDPAHEKLSVGTLLTHYIAQHVLEKDEVEALDYLTGDDSYKAQWMSERRPLYRLTLANPRRIKGLALAAKWRLRSALIGDAHTE